MCVLVVEDDPGVRDGVLALLQDHGFAASGAPDGAAALELVAATKPDVILLDLAMPQVGGDEFLERMRSDPALERIPVIVMSAWARRIEPPVPVAGWLPKPFQPQELLDLLGCLGQASARVPQSTS